MARARVRRKEDPAAKARLEGWRVVAAHPLFAPLGHYRLPVSAGSDVVPADGWAAVDRNGTIHSHPTRRGTPEEWTWVFAHLLLHLGLGHTDPSRSGGTRLDPAHGAVCDVAVNRFLATLKLGRAPVTQPPDWPTQDEESLGRLWREGGVPEEWAGGGTAGSLPDILAAPPSRYGRLPKWEELFAAGLTAAVTAAVEVAGGVRSDLSGGTGPVPVWEAARRWFLASYPLLGAVMSTLTLVADAELARGWGISVAAVSPSAGEVYVNPQAGLGTEEWRFVLAHEALHAALGHAERTGGRDAELWNIACDFVINGWLVEMAVGVMPECGLYDPQFAGESAEGVYDRIAVEARRYRKLATLRGHTGGDLLGEPARGMPGPVGVDLDELLRRALAGGLELHHQHGRGLLPSGWSGDPGAGAPADHLGRRAGTVVRRALPGREAGAVVRATVAAPVRRPDIPWPGPGCRRSW